MLDTMFKAEQVDLISRKLNLPKSHVDRILSEYINYLIKGLNEGKTVKFLNVCEIRVAGKDLEVYETLAYVANEIGKRVNETPTTTQWVLNSYEDIIIKELAKLNKVTIVGLLSLKLTKSSDGEYHVRSRKSTVYLGEDVRMSVLPSFRRKVGVALR